LIPWHLNQYNGAMAERKKKLEKLLHCKKVRTWRSLMVAFQTVYRELEKGLLADGCSMPRFQILLLLYFDAPLLPVEMAKRMFVTRGNISMFLKRVLSDGLIMVVTNESGGRRAKYQLTEKGTKLFEWLFPRHIGRIKKLVPILPKAQVDRLLAIPSHSNLTPPRF
jgi:MarR family transcriptional regulator, 2-MHQ and catechol-resistance regulon repressor